jgi:hypothetical protein
MAQFYNISNKLKLLDVANGVNNVLTILASGEVGLRTLSEIASDIGASGAALTKADDTNVTLTLGGSPTTALLNATSLTLGWTGQLSIARGGTGQSTATGAFNGLSPSTTLGDIIFHNGTDDIRLAGNITTTKKFLVQTGTGAVSAAPLWDTLVAGDVPASWRFGVSGEDADSGLSGTRIFTIDAGDSLSIRNDPADPEWGGLEIGVQTMQIRQFANSNKGLARVLVNTTTNSDSGHVTIEADGDNADNHRSLIKLDSAWDLASNATKTAAIELKVDGGTSNSNPSVSLLMNATATDAYMTLVGVTNDDTKTHVIVKDSSTNRVYYRSAASLGGGAYTDEEAQDAINSAFAAGTHNGISITYTDGSNKFDFSVVLISKTVAQMQTLASGDDFVPGAWYLITDADSGLYGGTNVIIQAVSVNQLSDTATGLFYNPKYDQNAAGYDIWSNWSSFTMSSISGTFVYGETITSNGGATGVYVAGQTVAATGGGMKGIFTVSTGNWVGATSITGGTSGATANIASITLAAYSNGNVVIWGGKHWTNGTGAVGSATDQFTLDGTNWTVITFNTTDYNLVSDPITYDLSADKITSRREIAGNNYVAFSVDSVDAVFPYTYSPIKVFQWGNPFDAGNYVGVGAQTVTNSYNHNLNFRGFYQHLITLDEQSYLEDLFFDTDCWMEQVYLRAGSYLDNITVIDDSSIWFYVAIDGFLLNTQISGTSQINSVQLRNGSSAQLTLTEGTTFRFTIMDNQSTASGLLNHSDMTDSTLMNHSTISNMKCTSESIDDVVLSDSTLNFNSGSWSVTNANVHNKSLTLAADYSGSTHLGTKLFIETVTADNAATTLLAIDTTTKEVFSRTVASLPGGSGISRSINLTSGSATMGSTASTDYVYFVTGAHTMSLPAAAGNTNRYTVKNNHSANITIDTAGAENVEGAASISIAPEESVDLLSDGTNWFVV